jgi:hypothetical protein
LYSLQFLLLSTSSWFCFPCCAGEGGGENIISFPNPQEVRIDSGEQKTNLPREKVAVLLCMQCTSHRRKETLSTKEFTQSSGLERFLKWSFNKKQ